MSFEPCAAALPPLRVARCVVCDPAVASPDVGFVEPMLRRRLSPLAKMALSAAQACAGDLGGVRMVFASRHGDVGRTVGLLECLADGEALSPTVFSMSVLNASAGLFSMLKKNTAPATAVSAGVATFAYGLLEACVQQAACPELPVLYVYADEPLPAIYGDADVGGVAHAVGVLLAADGGPCVEWSWSDDGCQPSAAPQSRAFLDCLAHGRGEWCGDGRRWRWERKDA